MRPKVKYWVYTRDLRVCRCSQTVDSHWRPVRQIICAVFGRLRIKIALWVTCARSARWRQRVTMGGQLFNPSRWQSVTGGSTQSSILPHRGATEDDGWQNRNKASRGTGGDGAPSWEIGCLWKKGSFKVKSLHFANPLQAMLSPLPVQPFHHSADMNSSLCRGEIPLAGL